jgi:SNF2-related domain/Restriction endonuclease/Helicase conserved C-terminal domain
LFRRSSPDDATSSVSIFAVVESSGLASLLDQLAQEDLATAQGDDVLITWEQVHELRRSRAYASSIPALELPPLSALAPRLQSKGGLTDPHFSIGIAGWVNAAGTPCVVQAVEGSVVRTDGVLQLLSKPAWQLLEAITAFDDRSVAEREPKQTRRHWGNIRRLALEADAVLDDFLVRSVVVTPETLDIEFRKITLGGTNVVEIIPGFDGAPARWLEAFDKATGIPEHFNIPTPDGAVHVVLSAPVRSVLGQIKKLPGRRAAGERAEAFLLNPIAALGEDAIKVIDPAQFQAAKERAGIQFERFRPRIVRDALGYPGEVGIEIDTPQGDAITRHFSDNEQLAEFIKGLQNRLERGLQLFAWEEFEFALDGSAKDYLAALKSALDDRLKLPMVIQHDQIHNLSTYYDRIVGIGEAQPFISSYIVKKSDDEGWFQSNFIAMLTFRPTGAHADVTIPITPESLPDVAAAIAKARQDGLDTITLPGCTEALPLAEVERDVLAFQSALAKPPAESDKPTTVSDEVKAKVRQTLLIKGNIETVEHQESREEKLVAPILQMQRPAALKTEVTLRRHQIEGVARLQHLYTVSPEHCRGVLLADDMGLGKTLQLLTFIAWALERDPVMAPAMIVAPVSLLENWQEETARFFGAGSLRVLTAYGDTLAKLRVPRESVDAALQGEGLVRFLKPDWRGDAQVVLTTYETLRDLEFSFAAAPWSILVCDEAQKIKNPNAMVTQAAKKLNVRFRVACTGTPVENSLADLWCLFDLVQPGLLGSLNAFGRDYGRIIETNADTAQERRESLRRLIDPQLIRRMKSDVADDLKLKIDMPECRSIAMSNEQRLLYVGALHQFNEPKEDHDQVHHLGLLQYLRLICADPRNYATEKFLPEDPQQYRLKAPKMDWLIRTLHDIRRKGEKALIFAEHRDVQRLLQHYIKLEFGFKPEIVNGDTSVSAKSATNRQKVIKTFSTTPGFGVIILSPLAVGFGVNIQAANHVIHYLRHWNPAKEDQATDRAYRIGQTKDVHVYCPLTVASEFKTFDVKLDELLELKRRMAGDILQIANTVPSAEFDLDEILPRSGSTLRNDPITPATIERCTPQLFEAIIAALWQKQGYRCHLTPKSSDAGVDVVGLGISGGVLMQCKTSSNSDRRLGWDAIKDVVGGTAIYEEQFPTARFRQLCVTNQRFNMNAHSRARANNVELIEQAMLGQLLIEHPITMLEVRTMLATRH